MARISWLHLSDLHLDPTRTGWETRPILSALRLDVLQLMEERALTPQFLFVTGDLAYGEKQKGDLKKQLGETFSWLKEVTKSLGIPKEQVFIVPGNHDVNRNQVAKSQIDWLRGLDTKPHDEALAQVNRMFQQPNFDWQTFQARLKDFYDETRPRYPHLYPKGNPHGCYHAIREIGGVKVGVFGFDGVWSSGEDREKGRLWLGAPWQLNLAKEQLAKADLSIGLIHHPPSWYVEAEEHELIQRLGGTFHLLLHGHTHNQWFVPEGANHLRIGAGAAYASAPEMGYNLGYWDSETGKGGIHFRAYNKRGGWHVMFLQDRTDSNGHAPFVLAAPEFKEPGDRQAGDRQSGDRQAGDRQSGDRPPDDGPADDEPNVVGGFGDESDRIVGRAETLEKLHELLKTRSLVVLYGLAGIGKTSVVIKLRQAWPLFRCLDCAAGMKPETFATHLAQFLASMKPEASPSAPYLLHLNQAEWVLEGEHASRNAVTLAKAMAARPDVHVLVESRTAVCLEHLKGHGAVGFHLKGVGVEAVVRFFKQPFRELKVGWSLTNDQAMTIWRRLGDATKGTSGFGAHPMAMILLAQLADARGTTPLVALQAFPDQLVEKLLEKLFREVFARMPNPFARLLAWFALYRNHIPKSHAFALQDQLQATGGLKYQLDRCLVRAGDHNAHFWVHALIRDLIPADTEHAQKGHHAIGSLWFKDLKVSQHAAMNVYAEAAEGAYHLILADAHGDIARLKPILSNRSGLVDHLFKLSERFNKEKRPKEVLTLMALAVAIDPDNGKAHGFLGLALEKTEGRGTAKALEHFRQSYALAPRPDNLANLGQGLLHAKQAAAFLELLEQPATQTHINDHVRAIQISSLTQLGRQREAVALRQQQIAAGSRHPAFYNDQARYLAETGNTEAALKLLDDAEKSGISDAFTQSIRASLLQASGKGSEASALRQQQIAAGSRNPAFYNDEARYLAETGNTEAALDLLDDAQKSGISNEFTQSIRASLLQASGKAIEASALRQQQIAAGSRNPAFYADEARYLAETGNTQAALQLLDRAEKSGISDVFTQSIRASLLEASGKGNEASALRQQQITAGSRDPAFYNDQARYLAETGNTEAALELLDHAEKSGISDAFTQSIRASLLQASGKGSEASALRQQQIAAGSRNPAFYNDEARYLAETGNTETALKLLDDAEKSGISDVFTQSIRASLLQASGKGSEASALRQQQIAAGSRNPAFYNDQARYLAETGNTEAALKLLDDAEKSGISDDFTLSIRASLLQASGKGNEASALRQQQIAAGSRNPVFYNDEARYLMELGQWHEAQTVLDKARALHLEDDFLRRTQRQLNQRRSG